MASRRRCDLASPTDGVAVPLARPERADGQLLYAIGDIHGRYDLLRQLLALIVADCAARAGDRRPILVLAGDYIDRGPDSSRVLAGLIWLGRHGAFELHCLKGNHEEAFLAFLDNPVGNAAWLGFGGDETLLSYGVRPPAPLDGEGDLIRARDDLLDVLPVAHLQFLRGLELILTIGDYAFVHAGIRPGVPLLDQRPQDLLWMREPFLGSTARHEKTIVHGHSWRSADPQVSPVRIGIDTGAYETDVLTAVRIEDNAIAFLQAGVPD
ncbi:metallophosphoesterase family protein [Sphingomonas nostoxanthinifaciens]|uniref:metallophosphoesterase family protein n=1 Tax=Sphingomonas nostoxanthinifaciens TaxID=2872652 RepID=UPI001CC21E72|nr:metallophosphoesterase family protein [Sphingomonas nostoxanthinifaciens]UAK23329.1 serine/threonine protein phosphatase [Sphingomonas nostoxanthinifaciens]